MQKKIKPKMNSYKIISEAIENGISGGLNKAYKYSDNPSRDSFEETIFSYIMLELGEVIDFGSDE